MKQPIRLHVGTSCNNEDTEFQSVLEFSARQHCSMPLEIVWMRISKDKSSPYRGWRSDSWRTPFSGLRWSAPPVCGYEGRAIYMDLDFIVRGDLAELWNEPMRDGVVFLAKSVGKTCCTLFDCARAKGHIPDLPVLRAMPDAQGDMTKYFKERKHLVGKFTTGDWNCIDLNGYPDINDSRIKAIHASRMETQPHLPYALKRLAAEGQSHWYTGPTGPHWRPELQALFDRLLAEATAAGYGPGKYRVAPAGDFKKRDFTYKHSKVSAA